MKSEHIWEELRDGNFAKPMMHQNHPLGRLTSSAMTVSYHANVSYTMSPPPEWTEKFSLKSRHQIRNRMPLNNPTMTMLEGFDI